MKVSISAPSPKQEEFLKAKKFHVGFGGARGGGKSWSVRTKAKLLGLKYAGIRMLIVRKTYPELMANHITPLKKELIGVGVYRDKNKIFEFNNGSTITFMYCNYDSDVDRLQGVEFDVIFFDEATQLSESQMKDISACCRGINNYPKRIYYTCNPGGQGHSYIKRIFIDKRYNDDENPDDYIFIQSLVTDNYALMASDPLYVKRLDALPPARKKAWRYGDWNIFEGQFFETFTDDPNHYKDRRWTHVIEPFEIPKSWNVYRSYDWGYAHPFSCGWWAVDHQGVIYRILELYGCTGEPNVGVKWTPHKQFEEIRRVEQEHRWLKGRQIYGVADPACWNSEAGESVMDVASKYGIYFDKGDNARLAGWMQMQYRLQMSEDGYPMMYVFNNCRDFIRTIPLLQYSKTKVEDVDTEGEDHIADETRYFCMSRPITPPIPSEEYTPQYDPLNMILDSNLKRYSMYRR